MSGDHPYNAEYLRFFALSCQPCIEAQIGQFCRPQVRRLIGYLAVPRATRSAHLPCLFLTRLPSFRRLRTRFQVSAERAAMPLRARAVRQDLGVDALVG